MSARMSLRVVPSSRRLRVYGRPASVRLTWRSVWVLKAIEHGYRVLFTTAAAMIAVLTRFERGTPGGEVENVYRAAAVAGG
jgi:hypothetical protein